MTHTCNRFNEEHPPGIDCLADGQVLHLLQWMDADTLLNVGRTSDRLYLLVCDKNVWRLLLNRVGAFTPEKIKELAVFVEKAKIPEMRQEMLREAGKRLKERAGEVRGRMMKFVLTIPGWGAPDTLEMYGGLHIEVMNL